MAESLYISKQVIIIEDEEWIQTVAGETLYLSICAHLTVMYDCSNGEAVHAIDFYLQMLPEVFRVSRFWNELLFFYHLFPILMEINVNQFREAICC